MNRLQMFRSAGVWLAIARLALFGGVAALAGDWPRFRGPNGTGLGVATNLPAVWQPEDYAFRIRLPGTGHSSPIIFGDRLFVTTAAREHLVICLNAATGKSLWERAFPLPQYPTHRNNSLATASPAADSARVFVPRIHDSELVLTALTHYGEPAWEFNLGPFETQHGLGHSPIVANDLVIFADDHDLAGRVLALEAATGKLKWETPRRSGRADYSTPCVMPAPNGGFWLLLNANEDGMGAVSLADGRPQWTAPGVLKMRSVSSPVVASGLVLGTCGSGGGGNYLVAIHPPLRESDAPRVAYEIRRSAPYVPTPVAVGDLVFLWSDAGIVSCVESASGKVIWQERVGGDYFASPAVTDGKLINVSTRGEAVLLAARREFQLLGRNSLGEPGNASPAVANGCLYLRTVSQVVAIKARDS